MLKNYPLKKDLLSIAFLSFSLLFSGSVFSAEANDSRLPVVTATKAKKQQLTQKVNVSGSLIAREELLINPQINGLEIKKINVDIGDVVKKGDTLILLDRRTLEVQLSQAKADVLKAKASFRQVKAQAESAKANLSKAYADLKRNKSLGNAIPAVMLADSQVATQVAKASYEGAKEAIQVASAQFVQQEAMQEIAFLNLSRTKIKSPVDGIVSERLAKLGDIANGGASPLLKIIVDGVVELEANVIESALPQIKKDNDVQINISGVGQKIGKVRLISPIIDPKTRLGKIRISLDKNPNVRSGGFADGWIDIMTKESIVVPVTAIQTTSSGDFVRVVNEEGVIEERTIIAGILSGKSREIISGLKEGELILEKAGGFYVNGDKVSVEK